MSLLAAWPNLKAMDEHDPSRHYTPCCLNGFLTPPFAVQLCSYSEDVPSICTDFWWDEDFNKFVVLLHQLFNMSWKSIMEGNDQDMLNKWCNKTTNSWKSSPHQYKWKDLRINWQLAALHGTRSEVRHHNTLLGKYRSVVPIYLSIYLSIYLPI